MFVIFGDSNANDIRPAHGAVFPFKCSIVDYANDRPGRALGSASGQIQSERGFLSFLVHLPSVKVKTRVLADVRVTLPGG